VETKLDLKLNERITILTFQVVRLLWKRKKIGKVITIFFSGRLLFHSTLKHAHYAMRYCPFWYKLGVGLWSVQTAQWNWAFSRHGPKKWIYSPTVLLR